MNSIRDSIQNDVSTSNEEVRERAEEEVDEDRRAKKLDNDIKEQDKDERKTYAERSFSLVSLWLLLIMVIMIAIGLDKMHFSDNVIITLLTTTTVEVIGIYFIVSRYLFPPKG